MKKMNSSMKMFCQLERSAIQSRLEQLTLLEEAISQHNIAEDIALFIEQAKQPEYTHRYSSALKLMDEFFIRK